MFEVSSVDETNSLHILVCVVAIKITRHSGDEGKTNDALDSCDWQWTQHVGTVMHHIASCQDMILPTGRCWGSFYHVFLRVNLIW